MQHARQRCRWSVAICAQRARKAIAVRSAQACWQGHSCNSSQRTAPQQGVLHRRGTRWPRRLQPKVAQFMAADPRDTSNLLAVHWRAIDRLTAML